MPGPSFFMGNADKRRAEEWYHGHGEDIRRKDGKHDPQRQWREDISADAGEKGYREKDDGGSRGRGGYGEGNLHAPPLPLLPGWHTHLHKAEDIFQPHHGVVDQTREG